MGGLLFGKAYPWVIIGIGLWRGLLRAVTELSGTLLP